jgi:hypothetical protein
MTREIPWLNSSVVSLKVLAKDDENKQILDFMSQPFEFELLLCVYFPLDEILSRRAAVQPRSNHPHYFCSTKKKGEHVDFQWGRRGQDDASSSQSFASSE